MQYNILNDRVDSLDEVDSQKRVHEKRTHYHEEEKTSTQDDVIIHYYVMRTQKNECFKNGLWRPDKEICSRGLEEREKRKLQIVNRREL